MAWRVGVAAPERALGANVPAVSDRSPGITSGGLQLLAPINESVHSREAIALRGDRYRPDCHFVPRLAQVLRSPLRS
jgi:hypothetical protein